MIRVSVSRDGAVIWKHTFRQDQIVIGRDPECAVRVDNVAVSRRHATITRAGAGWEIEDLQSGNGTFIDGVRITRQSLREKDTLVIGKYSILVEVVPDDPAAAPGASGSPGELATYRMDAMEVEKLVSKSILQGAGVRATLVPEEGEGTVMLERASHFAGSAPDCTVPASGPFVAPRLAIFLREAGSFRVVRVGGAFGRLAVNGQPADSAVLRAGDRIDICGRVYAYKPS
jgi:predicted component of type VI protein secretion system